MTPLNKVCSGRPQLQPCSGPLPGTPHHITSSHITPAMRSLAVRQLVPFMACGDLSGWDADRSYDLPSQGAAGYTPLQPVQPPTAPAYKAAIALSRTGGSRAR